MSPGAHVHAIVPRADFSLEILDSTFTRFLPSLSALGCCNGAVIRPYLRSPALRPNSLVFFVLFLGCSSCLTTSMIYCCSNVLPGESPRGLRQTVPGTLTNQIDPLYLVHGRTLFSHGIVPLSPQKTIGFSIHLGCQPLWQGADALDPQTLDRCSARSLSFSDVGPTILIRNKNTK